ncbi:MAG: hypothetical protein AB7L13_01350 [Acidimicrobiia bacterium]
MASMVVRGAVIGALVGIMLTVLVAVSGWPHARQSVDRSAPNSAAHRRDAKAFADAWERSLRGTWYVSFDFSRRLADGRTLTSGGTSAQRPPDRLTVQFGALTGRLGGRLIDCTPTPGAPSTLQCKNGEPALDYEAEVKRDVDRIKTYVGGALPIYVVDRDGRRCFKLRKQLNVVSPPYGDTARFCFDEATGAITDVAIERPGVLDTQTAVTVRADVADVDLELPPGVG